MPTKTPRRPGQRTLSVYLTVADGDLLQRIRMHAAARDVSVSDFIKAALVDALTFYDLEVGVYDLEAAVAAMVNKEEARKE